MKYTINIKYKQKIEEWLEMLRSGEYKQGDGYLWLFNDVGQECYCCLGVLCLANNFVFEEDQQCIESIAVLSTKKGDYPYTLRNIDVQYRRTIDVSDNPQAYFPTTVDGTTNEPTSFYTLAHVLSSVNDYDNSGSMDIMIYLWENKILEKKDNYTFKDIANLIEKLIEYETVERTS